MEWKHDVEVMDALAALANDTKDPLNRFLNALGAYNDGSPMFAFLQIYGVFVNQFVELMQKETETDSFELAVAQVANHPTVQSMVASMMQKQIDRGLQLDRS